MKRIIFIFASLFLSTTFAQAVTFYSLDNVKKAYLLVEIGGTKISQDYKESVYEELQNTTEELGIDTSGYSGRVIAFLIGERNVGEHTLVNVQLLVGEQVKRLDDTKETYADTYQKTKMFFYTDDDSLESDLEDAVYGLLDTFAEQYREENQQIKRVDISEHNFAKVMKYETNYDKALKRAQKEKKNIMLVLVSNYCPWCRKFEKNVLAQDKINKLVHEQYIPLIINKEEKNIPAELDQAFTPIVHFIDYKTKTSYKLIMGYHNKEEFIYTLKKNTL
jgi:hypothetical protein